jgi:exodeoxyribonuclease VII large subunit
MTLPLFPPEESNRPRTVTLIRLAAEIARSLASVGRVSVEGEVHRPTRSGGGRVYFTLRDRAAQVTVMCPRAKVSRCRTVAGERACVVGLLTWVNERGALLLVAEEVTPVGDGAVAAMVADVRHRLEADGLLGRPRRPVPRLPEVIGVVCGAEAAVRKDIESVVAARFPGYPVDFVETMVSGPGAALSILSALNVLADRPGVAVIILARGGGDATQLLPWSDEELCRAVSACPVPVVSAIGHEGDRPLCDDVADLRCGTPSLAASAVVPDRSALEAELGRLDERASTAAVRAAEAAGRRLAAVETAAAAGALAATGSARLSRAADRIALLHPRRQLAEARRHLAAVDWESPVVDRLGSASERVAADRRHLTALSPARTLERGYAVVTGPDGRVVRRARQVEVGQTVHVRVAAGQLGARVEEVAGD